MADRTLPNNWRVPRWLKIIGIIIAVVLGIALLMYVTGNGDKVVAIAEGAWDLLKQVWLWIVGFAGGILALFQGNRNKPSINDVKKEIETENARIGQELDGLKDSMNQVDKWRERERELHEREINLLERELALKNTQLDSLEEKIDTLASMSGQEFFESLPDKKKKEITDMMDESRIDL